MHIECRLQIVDLDIKRVQTGRSWPSKDRGRKALKLNDYVSVTYSYSGDLVEVIRAATLKCAMGVDSLTNSLRSSIAKFCHRLVIL